jgi:[ribosomal protein S5]-alanine N-acetyltransferase
MNLLFRELRGTLLKGVFFNGENISFIKVLGRKTMIFPILETDRLHLVKIGRQYSQQHYELMSLDKVTKYYGMDRLKNENEALTMIDSMNNTFLSKRGIRWGIILKENQKFIGTLGLNHLNLQNKRAEIGYELHPDFWRKGFTSEAVKEVLRFSFEDLGLYRIAAVIFPENIASAALLKN